MTHNIVAASLATAALTIAGPAVAQHAHVQTSTPTHVDSPTHADTSTTDLHHSTTDTDHETDATTTGLHHPTPDSDHDADTSTTAFHHPRTNSDHDVRTSTTSHEVNSQAPVHASPNGIAHANSHSVLAHGSVPASSLHGLITGLHVQTSTGTLLGTISHIIIGTDGSIRQVLVTSPTGQSYVLAPNTLSIANGVVTTTSTVTGG